MRNFLFRFFIEENMDFIKQKKESISDYLFDHPKTRRGLDWTWKMFVTIVSCFIFAWGFRAFVNPTTECVIQWTKTADTQEAYDIAKDIVEEVGVVKLVSGGASGMSQAIVKFMNIFGDFNLQEKTLISIFYFCINVPLFLLGWFKISKQFAVFTLINVGLVSLFNQIIPDAWVYKVINLYDDMIARCIFGGITTGIGSGAAMMINTSSGGTDVLSFYFAEKKSSGPGYFSFIINASVLIAYLLLGVIAHAVNPVVNPQESNQLIRYSLYTLIYLFVSVKVIDLLNIKNKKQELQIFTSDDNLSQVLIHAFPHSATTIDAKGAYTGNRRIVILMVLSKSEIKKATKIIQKADPLAFITVHPINQVYGKFYIRPIE